MANKIKETLVVLPSFNEACIKVIPKKKKSSLKERGIFLVNKLRYILVKLIYNSNIDNIEEIMTTSNIGARKNAAPRDHLYVCFAIINEVLKSKETKVDVVFYDIHQAFDSLWMEKSYTDLFKNGVNNDNLNLLHECSKAVNVAVKTPVGISKEKEINNIILQGETTR